LGALRVQQLGGQYVLQRVVQLQAQRAQIGRDDGDAPLRIERQLRLRPLRGGQALGGGVGVAAQLDALGSGLIGQLLHLQPQPLQLLQQRLQQRAQARKARQQQALRPARPGRRLI